MLFKSLIQAGKTYAPLFRYTINAGLESSKITINIISEAYNHNYQPLASGTNYIIGKIFRYKNLFDTKVYILSPENNYDKPYYSDFIQDIKNLPDNCFLNYITASFESPQRIVTLKIYGALPDNSSE